MKTLKKVFAALLIYSIGLHPAVAQVTPVVVSAVGESAAGGVVGAGSLQGGPRTLSLQSMSLGAPVTLQTSLPGTVGVQPRSAQPLPHPSIVSAALPAATPAPAATVSVARGTPVPAPTAQPGPSAQPSSAQRNAVDKNTPKGFLAQRIQPLATEVGKAGEDIGKSGGGDASAVAAEHQFSTLTGETDFAGTAAETPVSATFGQKFQSLLHRSNGIEEAPGQKPAEPKAPLTQVFKDPARNKAFWRYLAGYSVFLFGFEMYMVAQPYLISSITKNSLNSHADARARNAEAFNALVRENRSIARIAHWTAQAFAYIGIPLFTRGGEGPKKWLVRTTLIRAAVLALVPALFFATGLMSLHAAIWVLAGLMAAQSFFQGVAVTMDAGSTTRIIGDPSVTSAERTKANSILTFVGAVIAIIGPAVAGQISTIKDFFGKTGVGGAVIYGIYALAMAAAGLIYATVGLIGGKDAPKDGQAPEPPAEKKTPGAILKSLVVSLRDGFKLLWKSRFLRTMLGLSLIGSLFSDPLVFNVLPEYAEKLIGSNPGALGALMHIPVLGWLLHGLTSTPMGYFSMMVVFSSIGSIVAAALVKPLRKLFGRFGFKTDEALTIPFYLLAALEAPLFWAMIHWHSMVGIMVLYGLQALATGFIGITTSGINQKTLGKHTDEDVNKILAAESFLSIIAAIVSTVVYGFILTNIPLATSLLIAAVATAVVGALRVAAPWLSFTKDQRHPPASPPAAPKTAHDTPSDLTHQGPNSKQSVNL